ncbi:MAG: toxin-antitoxin system YwqK family antitoxin [Bacteroidia bacterium]
MKRIYILLLLLAFLASEKKIYGQTKKDSLQYFLMDSLKAFTVYADTAKTLNRIDANGKKQGAWKKNYPNGAMRYKGYFVDDQPVGDFVYYYSRDTIQAVLDYGNGTDGKAKATMYFPGGNLMAKGFYTQEKKDSTWCYYDPYGPVVSTENYLNGLKNGVCKIFYPNGQVNEERTWLNGKQNGIWRQYFENGAIKSLGRYQNDSLDGRVTFFYPDGVKIAAQGIYKNDVKNGEWIFYKDDGTVLNKQTFNMGHITKGQVVITQEEQDKLKKDYELKEEQNKEDQPK